MEDNKMKVDYICAKMSNLEFDIDEINYFREMIYDDDFWSNNKRLGVLSDFEVKLESLNDDRIEELSYFIIDEARKYVQYKNHSLINKICNKMNENGIGTTLCEFFRDNIDNDDFWSSKNRRVTIISDFESKLKSGDPKRIEMVGKFLEDEMRKKERGFVYKKGKGKMTREKRIENVLSKMSEYNFDTNLCRFFSEKINDYDLWTPEGSRIAIISDFEIKLNSDDSEKIEMVRDYLEYEIERYRKERFFVDKTIPWTVGIVTIVMIIVMIIGMMISSLSDNDVRKLSLFKEEFLVAVKNIIPTPLIIPSKLSQKPFSVEGIEVYDILSSRDNGWKGAEVYVYTEHRTSGERRVFILTCKEKGVVSEFRDNLRFDTLVALSNFDRAIKGRVVTWLGRDYQEYYLDSVSDIAVVRERGDALDEMWSVDVETGLE